jgi:hypothetical protein
VEVGGRMRAFAWRGRIGKLLFQIASPGVENSQSKILCTVQRHCYIDPRIDANTDNENGEALTMNE